MVYPDDIIYFYLRYSGCDKNQKTVWSYIQTISKNNFSGRKSMHSNRLFRQVYPEDVRMIRRNHLLNYLLTVNPKTKESIRSKNTYQLSKKNTPLFLRQRPSSESSIRLSWGFSRRPGYFYSRLSRFSD